jgi:hypothetical protein
MVLAAWPTGSPWFLRRSVGRNSPANPPRRKSFERAQKAGVERRGDLMCIDRPKGPLRSDNRVMENPARSKNTPGTDAAFDLLNEIAVDPASDERYPDGTVLIPADSPDASVLMSRALKKRRPIAIVYPDGGKIVAAPRGGALAFFERLLNRRPESKQSTPSVPLPADYHVEICWSYFFDGYRGFGSAASASCFCCSP